MFRFQMLWIHRGNKTALILYINDSNEGRIDIKCILHYTYNTHRDQKQCLFAIINIRTIIILGKFASLVCKNARETLKQRMLCFILNTSAMNDT